MMFNIQFECNAQYNIYFRTKQFILFFYLEQNGKLSFDPFKSGEKASSMVFPC